MRRSLIFSFCFILSGCSTIGFSDLFNDYATQVTPVRQAIESNNIAQAQSLIAKNSSMHSSYLLNQLEQARLADLANMQTDAQSQFENVYQQVQNKREAAKVQLSSGLEQSNALFTNDSAITYIPAPYEMSMLHSYKALNYVYKNDVEGALVEVRRANKVQVDALIQNQAALDSATKEAQQHYPSMSKVTRDVKNGFQNAYTFYLSALLYQSSKQYDDAYIDYKKALEIQPNNIYLQRDVLRLAKKQGFDQDLSEFKKRFGEAANIPSEQGEVVILFEQGLVPKQHEFKLRLPIFTSGGNARFYSLAMPVYKDNAYVRSINNISINAQNLVLSPLVHIESLAAKTLEDQIPARIARQILRLVAKEKVRAELARSTGDVGNIIANIYNLASEQADTRSWLTLPNQISVARSSLNSGAHSLTIGTQAPINFTVSKQRLTLIYLTSINNYFNYHVVQL
ncbi:MULTISPECIES: COG3014 family protein [unclassified Pseudoalteromonas]|uniref:COG3014 family protein n=1 Tax=unclassified Pseudoalteromonas TaxID=194690 RepID=UPI0015FB3036|nr:adenine DNA methylase [Pseudoalteromonas sp. SR45-4]MBB1370148.1 adenine DNA methylase [Pseudoalteromonas sp. SR45-4]MBO7925177.1 adenine DNA methylase [Pseudoalteromonas sp. K222D]